MCTLVIERLLLWAERYGEVLMLLQRYNARGWVVLNNKSIIR